MIKTANTQIQESQLSLFPSVNAEAPQLNTVYQYFFVISPPLSIKQNVKSYKHTLDKKVGLSDYNLHAIPNISLMSFHTMKPVNQNFIQAVSNLFANIQKFEIETNGFDCFTHHNSSGTIYAKIEDSGMLTGIYEGLHKLLGLKVRDYTPHLTVARTIPKENFNKAFALLKDKKFKKKFICENITILQRKMEYGSVSNCSVLTQINLKEMLINMIAA
jgi:2'-5' RNA ligase